MSIPDASDKILNMDGGGEDSVAYILLYRSVHLRRCRPTLRADEQACDSLSEPAFAESKELRVMDPAQIRVC